MSEPSYRSQMDDLKERIERLEEVVLMMADWIQDAQMWIQGRDAWEIKRTLREGTQHQRVMRERGNS